jgi:hypothetical protein
MISIEANNMVQWINLENLSIINVIKPFGIADKLIQNSKTGFCNDCGAIA